MVDIEYPRTKFTPLHFAIFHDNFEATKFLIQTVCWFLKAIVNEYYFYQYKHLYCYDVKLGFVKTNTKYNVTIKRVILSW